MTFQRVCFVVVWALVASTAPAFAADPWHLPGWQARAVVEIPQPLADAKVDTAAARVLCQGQAKADGSDYRVLDAAGKPVPFQLTFHDAGRYSLIAFRATNPKQRFFIYFGNAQAERAKEQVVVDPTPGAGPPKGDWVPHYGLVLQTIQRPAGDNPRTAADMAKLIAGSPYKHGARYQRRISDGYNPFGSSDYYISIYRGWMQIPKDGTYQFCTVSNEASFSFLDGKELIHWPGQHTVDRGARGEVNTKVQLTAGLHYIEYYHEEVVLDQMAFLGWRPSADEGQFAAIPEDVYPVPHEAKVIAYEDAKGALLRFEPVIADSVWPPEGRVGQYTRCRFQAGKVPALPAGTTYRWEFGDGQTATGETAEHVYLVAEQPATAEKPPDPVIYSVVLTAQGPLGTLTARWPLEVFEIEHVTEQFKEGQPKEYAKLAKQYDRSKLSAEALQELAHLLAENEEPAEAIEVGKEFITRFGASQPALTTARVRRLLADCAIRLGKGKIDEAIANYRAALVPETPAPEKLDVLARLIRLVGTDAGQPEKVNAIMEEVDKTWRASRPGKETKAAYRRTLIAMGDVLLWNKKLADASDFYKRAEALGAFIPSQVRKARIGAYPESLRDFIRNGNYGAALDLVDRWDESFPSDKPNGQTFFWRGKLLGLRGQHQDAARCLARALGLSPGAGYETEARWLLAEALEKIGRHDEARRELALLVKSGAKDEFCDKARDKLKKDLKPK
jgi:tetratricopeptide (TPR) repeat protein